MLRVIVGAGHTSRAGWISLEESELDITRAAAWLRWFAPCSIDAIVAEHVLEHLTPAESFSAAQNFYAFLNPYGHARIAVPDGLHPDLKYQAWVAPCTGFNGCDHKQLFDVYSLTELLNYVGLYVHPLEWHDETGFHAVPLNQDDGPIKRNSTGLYHALLSAWVGVNYTSLIVDAQKCQ